MDCEKFESTLIDELYGELDEVTSAAAKRHAAGCSKCASLIGGLRATRQVATLPLVSPPADLEDRILASVASVRAVKEAPKVVSIEEARLAPPASRRGGVVGWVMRPQLAVAALFLVMIGASAVFLNKRDDAKDSTAAMEARPERAASPSLASAAVPAATATATPAEPTVALQTPAEKTALAEDDRDGHPDTAKNKDLAQGDKGGNEIAAASASAAPKPEAIARLDRQLPPAPIAAAHASDSLREQDERKKADVLKSESQGQLAQNAPATRAGERGPYAPPSPPPPPQAYNYQQPQNTQSQTTTGQTVAANGYDNNNNAAPGGGGSASAYGAAVANYNSGRYRDALAGFDGLSASNLDAALFAARASERLGGCSAAVTRYDAVNKRAPATSQGIEAAFEEARCYQQIGNEPAARAILTRLAANANYEARARRSLQAMDSRQAQAPRPAATATAAPTATTAPAKPPAQAPNQQAPADPAAGRR